MYSNKDPIDNDIATTSVPNHLPNMKPPNKATGLPKPSKNTHRIVKAEKINVKKIILLSFTSTK